jgi:hypothetical protein
VHEEGIVFVIVRGETRRLGHFEFVTALCMLRRPLLRLRLV